MWEASTMHQDSTTKKTSFQAAGDGACTGTTKQRWYWEGARKKKAGKQKDQTATKWNSTDKWHACSRLLRKGSIGMQNLVTHATTEKNVLELQTTHQKLPIPFSIVLLSDTLSASIYTWNPTNLKDGIRLKTGRGVHHGKACQWQTPQRQQFFSWNW